MRIHYWLFLTAVVLGLALRVPGWFTADEKRHFGLFEPDEIQHVHIALIQFEKLAPELPLPETPQQVNARGYGKLLGVVAYAWWRLSGQEPSVAGLVLMGRQLSTLYFLLLLFVAYRLARELGLERAAAAWAPLLLALCDLNATYSHYAVPASGYLLLLTVFMWGGVRYWRGRARPETLRRNFETPQPETPRRNFGAFLAKDAFEEHRRRGVAGFLLLALGAGGCFAFKFDFLPLVVGLGVLLASASSGSPFSVRPAGGDRGKQLAIWRWIEPLFRLRTWAIVVLFLAATVFFYQLCVAFNFTWAGMAYSFEVMSQENRDVIARDLHWLVNPTLYLLAVVAGIGLPACAAALFGAMRLRGHSAPAEKPRLHWWHHGWWIPAGLLLLEFGVRWSIDTPFVRRANEFMPFLAILAAYGLHRTWLAPRRARQLRWAVAGYGLALCLVGQSNHWFDTRERARAFLLAQYADSEQRIAYTEYAYAAGSPKSGRFRRGEWDLLVTAEPWYSRFHRSFTTPTPGRQPHCGSEIYHNPGERECAFFQRILRGDHPDIRQVAHFRTRTVLPERWLYRWLFGTFETFVGDVRIFEWTANDSGPPSVMEE